jgi:hypothetical protein
LSMDIGHPSTTGDCLPVMIDFHFRDLEMTPQRSSQVKVNADSESLVSSS